MEKAKYSGRYNGKDPSNPPIYTEFPTTPEERQRMWDNQISFDIELNAISKFEDPRKNPMSSWTCHTSVYNIKERTMQLVIGEKYDDIIPSATTSFKINGSK